MALLVQTVLIGSAVIVITYLIQKVCKFYYQLTHLPPGPFPLPFIGNLLSFRKNAHAHEVILELAQRHGSVFTLFMGSDPSIVITDPRIGIPVLKKHTFAGRPVLKFTDYYCKDGSIDIIFADFTKEWEALRKVGHLAARKFAVSPRLSILVNDAVDHLMDHVKSEPFDTNSNLCKMMVSILASTAFGKKYEFDDPEFLEWKDLLDFGNAHTTELMVVEFFPPFKHVYRKTMQKMVEVCDREIEYTERELKKAADNFEEGKINTFCDAIIASKREAEREESAITKYLTTANLVNAINNLFEAGVETTKTTTMWAFLLMAKYPEMQTVLRKEVDDVMGAERPSLEHRGACHKLNAFISETQRFRPIVANGLPHKATCDTEISGLKVRKGTTIMVPLITALHDREAWGDPEVFRPNRFLDENENHIAKPNSCFIPFGDGRRSCPGSKLASNNLFIILSRFLQRTQYIDVYGGVENVDLGGDPNKSNVWSPYDFSLLLT